MKRSQRGTPKVQTRPVRRSDGISDEADRAWLIATFRSFEEERSDLETLIAWQTKRSMNQPGFTSRVPTLGHVRRSAGRRLEDHVLRLLPGS